MTSFLNYVTATLRALFEWHRSIHQALYKMGEFCKLLGILHRMEMQKFEIGTHFIVACIIIVSSSLKSCLIRQSGNKMPHFTQFEFLKNVIEKMMLEIWSIKRPEWVNAHLSNINKVQRKTKCAKDNSHSRPYFTYISYHQQINYPGEKLSQLSVCKQRRLYIYNLHKVFDGIYESPFLSFCSHHVQAVTLDLKNCSSWPKGVSWSWLKVITRRSWTVYM